MSDKITIYLIGEEEVFTREIKHLDPDEPQYRNLSDFEREVYHYGRTDPDGKHFFKLMGREDRHYPKIRGAR